MDASGAEDGTDFRPFFDMVIGILFVLLILVAAQIYFQQAQVDTVASDAARREAALRRADIASFLNALADRLRGAGLSAVADVEGGSVSVPLRELLMVDGAGLPAVAAPAAARLGAALATATGCVTVPRRPAPSCPDAERLHLEEVSVETRPAAPSLGAALPGDRFATLVSALVSAAVLGAAPDLLAESNDAGVSVVRFGPAVTSASPAKQDGRSVDGDVALRFLFR